MADIRFTSGNDSYTQPAGSDAWDTYLGAQGNDQFKLYQGMVLGGAGNDHIERLPSSDWWRVVGVAYWDSPSAVRVDLAAGWAEDGHGGRDTLVDVSEVSGSGFNDWLSGNGNDNKFWSGGGLDTILGGAGDDTLGALWHEAVPGQPWVPARLEELDIQVSVDGRTAQVSPKGKSNYVASTTDVEYLEVSGGRDENDQEIWIKYLLADFIRPEDMAQQAIASGGDLRWNAGQALGTAVTLSYSFVTQAPGSGVGATGFRAFTSAEQQLVRDLLARTSAVAGISFTEVAEGGGNSGQLRFGVSQQADTKGVSWQPNEPGAGALAGDVWMDAESMAGLAPGSEGYAALLHEIGHALGLRHPRNVDPDDQYTVQLRAQDDRTALTAMSQTVSADGLFRADWGMLDVQALRYLYGSRSTRGGDDVYQLGSAESSAQTTIIDDGGSDTIDASAMAAGVDLDLGGGRLSSAGVSAGGFGGVDNLGIAIGSAIEHAVGSAFDDVLLGNALDNRLTGAAGNDWIEGGAGTDTAVFTGRRADYQVSNGFGKVFVESRSGSGGFDTLTGIERLQFDDVTVQLSAQVLGADAELAVDEDGLLAAALPAPSDVAPSTVSYRLSGTPAHGTASISASGQLSYTPQRDFHGIDTVAYELVGSGGSNGYLAFVSVLPVNDGAPVAADGNYLAQGGALMQAALPRATDVDGDAISYALGLDAAHGEVIVGANGDFSYRSSGGYVGSDSFTYTISDGMGGSASYTVGLDVVGVANLFSGGDGVDDLAAQAGGDGYSGYGGNDRITGGGGDDLVDGGSGIDTAAFAGRRADFTLTRSATHWTVADKTGAEGSDRLVAVERLQFADLHVALDLDGHAGQAAQIIRALLGPQHLQNEAYVGIGLSLFDGGFSYASVVDLALGVVPLFAGGSSNEAFFKHIYRNVIGVEPGAAQLSQFVGLLDSGVYSQSSLALLACQIEFNTASADLVGLAATGIEYLPG